MDYESPRGRFAELRERAESLLQQHSRSINARDLSAEEFLRLLNELEIHQIELELQNEELLKTQRALEKSRREYRDLYEFAPAGYLTVDMQGTITAINLTGATMLGLDRKRVLQRTLTQFIVREDRDAFYLFRRQLLKSQTRQTVELRILREGDAPFWARLEGVPESTDNGGDAQYCRVMMSDISIQKQAQADAQALALEQEKVRILKQFIGDVSHDLKTPLTVIGTSIYLLRRQGASADQQRHLKTLETETSRLEKTLEGLMSMTRLDLSTEFEFRTLDANALVAGVVDAHQTLAQQQGHTLAAIPDSVRPKIRGDRTQLERALSNLIINAMNHMPTPGRITLRVHADTERTIIDVRDTGVGIPPEDQPHIFERFYRGKYARDRVQRGTGLGLAIVRKVIEAHDGVIEVDSVPGKGSTFTLYLPRT